MSKNINFDVETNFEFHNYPLEVAMLNEKLATTQAMLDESIKIANDFKQLANKVVTEQETTKAQLAEASEMLKRLIENKPIWGNFGVWDEAEKFLAKQKERTE
jgi:hypothetical protein